MTEIQKLCFLINSILRRIWSFFLILHPILIIHLSVFPCLTTILFLTASGEYIQKNYKMLGDHFKINRHKWTKRLSNRLCDVLLNLREEGCEIYRCDINQLRQAYGLGAHFLARTSPDCKSLQNSLKLKYGFSELPDNMLAASSLEAIICAMFARYIAQGGKTGELYCFEGIPALYKPI